MPSFRLNAQQLFLTYPRFTSTLSLTEIYNLLETKLRERFQTGVLKYIVAEEEHADGGRHIHVYLKLEKKINCRETNFFDIDSHHGNYQGARSGRAVEEYCSKDGNFITNYYTRKIKIADCLSVDTKEDFFDTFKSADPRNFILKQRELEYYADKFFKTDSSYKQQYDLDSYSGVPEELTFWLNNKIGSFDHRPGSLIISGVSRLGKSMYIRDYFAHLGANVAYMAHMFDVSELPRNRPDVIIFDDFSWDHFASQYKPWFGTQPESSC